MISRAFAFTWVVAAHISALVGRAASVSRCRPKKGCGKTHQLKTRFSPSLQNGVSQCVTMSWNSCSWHDMGTLQESYMQTAAACKLNQSPPFSISFCVSCPQRLLDLHCVAGPVSRRDPAARTVVPEIQAE